MSVSQFTDQRGRADVRLPQLMDEERPQARVGLLLQGIPQVLRLPQMPQGNSCAGLSLPIAIEQLMSGRRFHRVIELHFGNRGISFD